MMIAGDSVYTILQVSGQKVHELTLHPSLLSGPFVFDETSYRVLNQMVERRVISRVVTKYIGESLAYGENLASLAYCAEDGPEWVVVLNLEPIPGGAVSDG